MMCADFASLKTEIENLEKGGIDIFHLDVMDGSFVPNFGMGLQDIEYICKTATKPCDMHLMIENPAKYVEKFVEETKNYEGYDVMIDGACSPEKIEMLSKIGVKEFILGTSALFGKGRSYQEIIEELRAS
ncbi:MAG: hypothetical protein Q4Q31_04460 [Bacillota bacterium]|nr:hypothetical protein [Bacillota bacterium]